MRNLLVHPGVLCIFEVFERERDVLGSNLDPNLILQHEIQKLCMRKTWAAISGAWDGVSEFPL